MEQNNKIAGMIFAGGRGLRMGGRDKAFLEFEGRAFIEILTGLMRAEVEQVYISRQSDQRDVSKFGEVVFDNWPDHGPLAGLVTVSKRAIADGFDMLWTLPVDTQSFPYNLLKSLKKSCSPHAMVRTKMGLQPTFSLYDLTAMDAIFAAFDRGERKLRSWILDENCGFVDIDWELISNVNQL